MPYAMPSKNESTHLTDRVFGSGILFAARAALLVHYLQQLSSSNFVSFLVLLTLSFTLNSVAQWERMSNINATCVISAVYHDHRMVAMMSNGEIFRSSVDTVCWERFAVLPRYINTARIRQLHSGPDNGLYVLTEDHLLRYNEQHDQWKLMTETLVKMNKRLPLLDVAIRNDSVYYLAEYSGPLHWTEDGGRTWSSVKVYFPSHPANHLQISPDGTLYINTDSGIHVSRDGLESVTPLRNTGPNPRFDLTNTSNNFIVVDDTTIYGLSSEGNVHRFRHEVNEWELTRTRAPFREYNPRIGTGADGTLFYLYNFVPGTTQEVGGVAIEWSLDFGKHWNNVLIRKPSEGSTFLHCEVLTGNREWLVRYEPMLPGGGIYETSLSTASTSLRSANVMCYNAKSIRANHNTIWLNGPQGYNFFFDKIENQMRFVLGYPAITNTHLHENGTLYFLIDMTPISNILRMSSPWTNQAAVLICGGSSFIVTSDEDLITAIEDSGVSRWDSTCVRSLLISHFPEAVYTAINSRDQYIAVGRKGEFEYRDSTNILLSKGQLAPFVDSVRAVQNDTRGNIVMLGVRDAYYSSDYGARWQRSSLDNNGAGMTTVIVDHNDHFYVLDENNTVYWSADAGASFTPFPVDLDSLFCGVTDIEVDEEYLYAGTSGCGVFRRALPSINSIEQLRPVARRHEAVNLALAAGQPLRIDTPFALDERTLFRLSDINGRVLQQVTFTVDRHHACILAQLPSLPGGVYTYALASSTDVLTGKIIIGK